MAEAPPSPMDSIKVGFLGATDMMNTIYYCYCLTKNYENNAN